MTNRQWWSIAVAQMVLGLSWIGGLVVLIVKIVKIVS